MTDRFVLKYSQRAAQQEPGPLNQGGIVTGRPGTRRNRPLHDQRTADSLLEYLDDLDE